MHIGVLGCNYKSGDLSIREAFVQGCLKCFGGEKLSLFKGVLLTTCNRTELYFSALDLAAYHSELLHLLRHEINTSFEPWLYSYFGIDCFSHLALVTAGLDSVVIGESEIQRQVKDAYETACLYSSLPSTLHFLFQKCLKIGKNIRYSFPLAKGKMNFPTLVFHLCKDLLQTATSPSVLFMGNSEINRSIMTFLKTQGMSQLTLCTRAPHSAKELLEDHLIQVMNWSHLDRWQNFDIVICGTHHSSYLISPSQIKKNTPLQTKIIFDLGMPRNVDPQLDFNPQLTLLNVEKLGQFITERQKAHQEQATKAREWVIRAAQDQVSLFHEKEQKAYVCI